MTLLCTRSSNLSHVLVPKTSSSVMNHSFKNQHSESLNTEHNTSKSNHQATQHMKPHEIQKIVQINKALHQIFQPQQKYVSGCKNAHAHKSHKINCKITHENTAKPASHLHRTVSLSYNVTLQFV